MTRRRSVNVAGVGFIVAILLLWELLARTAFSGLETIAPASKSISALGRMVSDGDLLGQILHTVGVTLLGWLLAVVIGLLLGTLLGLFPVLWRWSMASVDVLRSVPAISFVPLALLIFGFSYTMELVIVVYVSQWPVLLGALGGIRAVDAHLLDSARTLRLSRWRTVTHVVLPGAFPSVVVGMRLALALSVALAVVAEMLGNPGGLGFGIVFSQRAFAPDEVFAYLIVIGLVGWGLNALFVTLARRALPGYGSVV